MVAVYGHARDLPAQDRRNERTGLAVVLLAHGLAGLHGQRVPGHPRDALGDSEGGIREVELTAQERHPVVLTQLVRRDLHGEGGVQRLDRRAAAAYDHPPSHRVVGRFGETVAPATRSLRNQEPW